MTVSKASDLRGYFLSKIIQLLHKLKHNTYSYKPTHNLNDISDTAHPSNSHHRHEIRLDVDTKRKHIVSCLHSCEQCNKSLHNYLSFSPIFFPSIANNSLAEALNQTPPLDSRFRIVIAMTTCSKIGRRRRIRAKKKAKFAEAGKNALSADRQKTTSTK